jgi:alkylation response protein AidB-like acyl-CoA dehydrogenase
MSVLVVEELSGIDPSVGTLVDVQNTLIVNALKRWGSDELRAYYFPKLASEWVGAYALLEAGSSSDAFSLSCRATPDGYDWVLEGQKLWITNGAEASTFIVFATVDPDTGHKGIIAFVVDRDSDGFSVGKK